jgi:hypothetical protein
MASEHMLFRRRFRRFSGRSELVGAKHREKAPCRDRQTYVRFGSLADIGERIRHVRFTPQWRTCGGSASMSAKWQKLTQSHQERRNPGRVAGASKSGLFGRARAGFGETQAPRRSLFNVDDRKKKKPRLTAQPVRATQGPWPRHRRPSNLALGTPTSRHRGRAAWSKR